MAALSLPRETQELKDKDILKANKFMYVFSLLILFKDRSFLHILDAFVNNPSLLQTRTLNLKVKQQQQRQIIAQGQNHWKSKHISQ